MCTTNLVVPWTDKRLARVTGLCVHGPDGMSWFDVLCCHGELRDGTRCFVRLPFSQLPKGQERVTVVRHAKAEKVFAKGLMLLDALKHVTGQQAGVASGPVRLPRPGSRTTTSDLPLPVAA